MTDRPRRGETVELIGPIAARVFSDIREAHPLPPHPVAPSAPAPARKDADHE